MSVARLAVALVVLVHGAGCAAEPGSSADGPPTPASPPSASASASEAGAWPGGDFEGVLAGRPEETGTPGRYGVLVSDLAPDVLGADQAEVFFDLDSGVCSSGSSADLDSFAPGRVVVFSSPPDPAGLEAMDPPAVGASTVTLDCQGG